MVPSDGLVNKQLWVLPYQVPNHHAAGSALSHVARDGHVTVRACEFSKAVNRLSEATRADLLAVRERKVAVLQVWGCPAGGIIITYREKGANAMLVHTACRSPVTDP